MHKQARLALEVEWKILMEGNLYNMLNRIKPRTTKAQKLGTQCPGVLSIQACSVGIITGLAIAIPETSQAVSRILKL